MHTHIAETKSTFALDDIARDYGRLVAAVCRRMILEEETARDAARQVWVEIVKSYPSFRGESKISTWIYTITRRVAMDYAKSERLISTRFLRQYSLKEEFDLPANTDLDKALWVKEIDLAKEYEKIRKTVHRVNFYKQSETVLPRKNYWETLL